MGREKEGRRNHLWWLRVADPRHPRGRKRLRACGAWHEASEQVMVAGNGLACKGCGERGGGQRGGVGGKCEGGKGRRKGAPTVSPILLLLIRLVRQTSADGRHIEAGQPRTRVGPSLQVLMLFAETRPPYPPCLPNYCQPGGGTTPSRLPGSLASVGGRSELICIAPTSCSHSRPRMHTVMCLGLPVEAWVPESIEGCSPRPVFFFTLSESGQAKGLRERCGGCNGMLAGDGALR